eukprot:1181529-Amphidinium_carterae.2
MATAAEKFCLDLRSQEVFWVGRAGFLALLCLSLYYFHHWIMSRTGSTLPTIAQGATKTKEEASQRHAPLPLGGFCPSLHVCHCGQPPYPFGQGGAVAVKTCPCSCVPRGSQQLTSRESALSRPKIWPQL